MLKKSSIVLRTIPASEPLYHYTKINGIQGILRDRAFFATNGNFLNDTNELLYTLQVLRKVIGDLDDHRWISIFSEELPELEKELRDTDLFVISYSSDPDSITLWSEFGDRTGYNLEFNSGELLKRIGEHRTVRYHGFLIYDPEAQKSLLRSLMMEIIPAELGLSFEEIMDSSERENRIFRSYMKKLRDAIAVYAVFFKQAEFAAEKEYRVVFREQSPDEIEFRAHDGVLIPYIPISLGNEKDCIRRITVAPKNHMDLAESGLRIYARHLGYDLEVGMSKIQLRY